MIMSLIMLLMVVEIHVIFVRFMVLFCIRTYMSVMVLVGVVLLVDLAPLMAVVIFVRVMILVCIGT